MSRKGAELSTETKESIITLSESVQNKAELSRMLNIPRTTITSVLSKYRRTGTVETLTRSGRKRSFTNRDRNALKRLVKSNRRLTVQDITAKLNECKTKTFSQRIVESLRVLHSGGYKRRLAKKKMVSHIQLIFTLQSICNQLIDLFRDLVSVVLKYKINARQKTYLGFSPL